MIGVILATRNQKKFLELRALLKVPGVRWHSLAQFSAAPEVEERGRTFQANAIKKALQTARATGWYALADDSGLEIDALDGAPGVRSARFARRHGDDEANNAKVLRLLEGIPIAQRTARYHCVLALAHPTAVLVVTEGTWEGRIGFVSRGARGFGYDPLFVVPRLRRTAAQLPASVKHRMSHRAIAARAMRRAFAELVSATGHPAAARAVG